MCSDSEQLALETLRMLAVQVNMASRVQVIRSYMGLCEEPEKVCDGSLRFLLRAGLIERATIEVRTAGPATKPVFVWQPDWGDPDRAELEELAESLAVRWSSPFEAVEVYIASRVAANLFGVRGAGVGRPCEWSHNFRLTEVFLHYREHSPDLLTRWVGEVAVTKWGKRVKHMKDPDAFLMDQRGQIERVIEVAGKYTADHLSDIHQHCGGEAYRRLNDLADENGADSSLHPYGRREIGYELW